MDVCVAAAGRLSSTATTGLDFTSENFQKVCARPPSQEPWKWLLIQSAVAGDEREHERRPVHGAGGWEADAAVRERGEHHHDREHQRARLEQGPRYSLFIFVCLEQSSAYH